MEDYKYDYNDILTLVKINLDLENEVCEKAGEALLLAFDFVFEQNVKQELVKFTQSNPPRKTTFSYLIDEEDEARIKILGELLLNNPRPAKVLHLVWRQLKLPRLPLGTATKTYPDRQASKVIDYIGEHDETGFLVDLLILIGGSFRDQPSVWLDKYSYLWDDQLWRKGSSYPINWSRADSIKKENNDWVKHALDMLPNFKEIGFTHNNPVIKEVGANKQLIKTITSSLARQLTSVYHDHRKTYNWSQECDELIIVNPKSIRALPPEAHVHELKLSLLEKWNELGLDQATKEGEGRVYDRNRVLKVLKDLGYEELSILIKEGLFDEEDKTDKVYFPENEMELEPRPPSETETETETEPQKTFGRPIKIASLPKIN